MDSTVDQAVQNAVTLVSTWGLRIVGALAVLIIGRLACGIARKAVRRGLESRRVDASLVPFISNLVYFVLLAAVVIAMLGLFGIQTTSLVAVLGTAGLAVGLARRRRIGDAVTILRGNSVPAFPTDPCDQGAVDVERDHRHPVLACEVEKRQVEVRVEAPDLRPVHLAKERFGGQFACHPSVENRLNPARKHLETEDHVGPAAMQGGDGMQLPAVMASIVMALAEQHDRAPGLCGDYIIVPKTRTRLGIDPDTDRRTRRGEPGNCVRPWLGGAGGKQGDKPGADGNGENSRPDRFRKAHDPGVPRHRSGWLAANEYFALREPWFQTSVRSEFLRGQKQRWSYSGYSKQSHRDRKGGCKG